MTVASFFAAQRTDHGVSHAKCWRWLGVPESWFYEWRDRSPTHCGRLRGELDAAVKESFDDSAGNPGTDGSLQVRRGPDRRRLGGLEDDCGRLHVTPGSCGPAPEAQATGRHPPRPDHRSDPWPGQA